MHKDLTEELSIEDYKMELENRIRNLLWTVSGDYTLDVKPDVSLFLRSKEIALYDGIKQGAFARYFDKNLLGLYLVKKIYLDASETELTGLTQLCIEAAVGERICEERPGVRRMRKKALEDILDQEYETLPSYDKLLDRLKIAVFRDVLTGSVQPLEKKLSAFRDQIYACAESRDTMELIRIIDSLYNAVIDPDFEKKNGSLERVMAVTLEELTEFGWEDYLNEEMYEEALENYVEKLTDRMTDIEDSSLTQDMEEKRKVKNKITVISEEALQKAHTYVELNFGKTYLTPAEEKRMNHLMCRGIHGDCSLYFTEGILKNPVAFILTFVRSLDAFGLAYLTEMVGSTLGWLNIPVCSLLAVGYLVMMLLQVSRNNDMEGIRMDPFAKIMLAGISILVFGLIFVTLYGQWTAYGYDKILGVQGRYFLPLLLPVVLAFKPKRFAEGTNGTPWGLFLGAWSIDLCVYATLFVQALCRFA